MSQSNVRMIFCFSWAVVIISAFFFPANFDGIHPRLHNLGEMIADIRVKSNESQFPAALVMTYLMAIFFAVVLAMLSLRSRKIFGVAMSLRLTRGRLGCLIFVGGLAIMPIALVFLEMKATLGTSAEFFFEAMSRNRIFLALWCSGVLFNFYTYIIAIVAAIIGIFMMNKKND